MFKINSVKLQPSSSVILGAIWTLLASFGLVAFTTISQYLTQEMSVAMITFFRCVFGLFFIAPWIFRVGISGLVTQRPILLFSRGINTLLGLYGVFAAVSLIPVADVVTIMYSKPNFASIAAFLILR